MIDPDDSVIPGMQVSAMYNDPCVSLKNESEVSQNVFSDVVLNFEPVLAEKPSDLAEGEEVRIERQHICWISA